jgi:hypothetical protein
MPATPCPRCHSTEPLKNVRPWPELGASIGECRCGNTRVVELPDPSGR